MGVAANNNVPGARWGAISWTDESGNLNDLWKYNPTSKQWTWVGGSNASGAYGVYGLQNTAASSNMPGARSSGTSWRDDAGNLWMLGGLGHNESNTGYLNDLWEYNVSTNQWAWISGESTTDTAGAYGTQGIASVANYPGGRFDAVSWVDNDGSFWIFGGAGNGASTNGNLNDLWMYSGINAESAFPVIEYTSFPAYSLGGTYITGIRAINNSTNVYMSVISPSPTSSLGLIYAGSLNGQGGTWDQLNYPAPSGITVQSTTLYGPTNGSSTGIIDVVGSYTNTESTTSFGLLYQGALNDGANPANWTLLTPPSAVSTIAHSNMENLVAGNYNVANDPAGKAFIYDKQAKSYTTINNPDTPESSVTIYGIWYNGGTSYTIAGGYSNLNAQGMDIGYNC